ncbi:MAG: class I SAM-dependent methyltransferase [Pseudomonadota bacterium]
MSKQNTKHEKLLIRALNAEADARTLRKTKSLLHSLLDTTVHSFSKARFPKSSENKTFGGISFIIAYYDIPDQIERTLMTCSPEYQDIPAEKIDVIIADNGSNIPLPDDLQERFPFVSKILRTEGKPSPVFALNAAISEARFESVALMIDGAHMLSPGIVGLTEQIYEAFERPVINIPQYLLGRFSQGLRSQEDAFKHETRRLNHLNWPENGYALFDFCVRPGESPFKDYYSTPESNCLITTKSVIEDCGGFDERFTEPGAGFANLELFFRLTHHPENTYVLFPGEGSFHQNHDGAIVGKSPTTRDKTLNEFRSKYKEIIGHEVVFNARAPFMFGPVRLSTVNIPTISSEFGQNRNRIVRELAEIYAARAEAGVTNGNHPELAINGKPIDRKAFKRLAPLNLIETESRFANRDMLELNYASYLERLHKALEPKLYFEIGVDGGVSLSLSRCPSIGVDPAYLITSEIAAPARLFRITSDEFFDDKERCASLLKQGIDLSFIDGMHLSEYVLRDFINVEKWCRPDGVIVIDDVLPEQMEMAPRDREYNSWCGDVYKIIPVLRKYRPDLDIHVFEAFTGPTRKGLALIRNLDPDSRVLADHCDQISKDMIGDTYDVESVQALEDLVEVSWNKSFDEYLHELKAGQVS